MDSDMDADNKAKDLDVINEKVSIARQLQRGLGKRPKKDFWQHLKLFKFDMR